MKWVEKYNKTLPCITHQQESVLLSSELFCQVSCHIHFISHLTAGTNGKLALSSEKHRSEKK